MRGLLLLVGVWAGAPDGPETVYNDAGYIGVGPSSRHRLFYWLFESRNDPATDPWIIWMSGGPGCSSQLALFAENGPYQVQDGNLTLNPWSWNRKATVVWVDQPVGTGFSYGGLDHDEIEVGSDMKEFILGLMDKYAQLEDLDLYIFGESYAGHYVPVVADAVVDEPRVRLAGAGIGNGLTMPEIQYKYYVPFATQHDLVSEPVLGLMKGVEKVCEPLIEQCNRANASVVEWNTCLNAYVTCNFGEVTPVQSTGVNVYDVRIPCGDSELCYDFSDVDEYLNRRDVKEALGVHKPWQECSHLVDLALVYGGDWMKAYNHQVAHLLDSGVKVLIYAGEYDFICNWMGNHAWSSHLQFEGHDAFANATNLTFTDGNSTFGEYKSAANFTFLKVYNAGHLAPHDQPEATAKMVERFISTSF